MGTRSITTVRSKWTDGEENESYEWKTYATIYVHFDGYLDGVGRWLYEFLDGLVVVNGISLTQEMPERYANGPGRLASQIVVAMHNDGMEPGLAPHDSHMGQEYHYQIDVIFGMGGGSITVSVFDGPMTLFGGGGDKCTNLIFTGTVAEFGNFLDSHSEEDDDEI